MESGFVKNVFISLAMALVLVVVVNVIGELTVRPRAELPPPQPTATAEITKIPEVEPTPAGQKPAPVENANQLAAYDSKAGKKAFRKCKSCHTSAKGDKNRVGPNLWDVMGRQKAGIEGYKYSDAMKLKGGTWTYKDLDQFLTNPRTYVIGTKMSIKGYRDPVQRAVLIGYLRSLSDDPKAPPQ